MKRYVYPFVNVETNSLVMTRFGTPLVNEIWGTSVKVPGRLDISVSQWAYWLTSAWGHAELVFSCEGIGGSSCCRHTLRGD